MMTYEEEKILYTIQKLKELLGDNANELRIYYMTKFQSVPDEIVNKIQQDFDAEKANEK